MRKLTYLALYGNVMMIRAHCKSCGGWTLVRKGIKLCCDRRLYAEPNKWQRMSQPSDERKKPTVAVQKEILTAQDYRCLYCLRSFGSYVMRGSLRQIKLKVTWDHLVPFAFAQDNRAHNFVAACQICNGLKGDTCYASVEDARAALTALREAKGYL